MRDNADFSAQGLQGIQACDGYVEGFRVETCSSVCELSLVGCTLAD